MHEAKFTAEIVNAIIEELKAYKDKIPQLVKVSVGEMLHLEPDSVRFHFELQTKGTILEGIKLDLTEEPVMLFCRQCQKEGQAEDHHFLFCPYCRGTDVEVRSGKQIIIHRIDLK